MDETRENESVSTLYSIKKKKKCHEFVNKHFLFSSLTATDATVFDDVCLRDSVS